MKHGVYIRLNYEDFTLFLQRVDIFRKTAVPSLLAQNLSFDVQILVRNDNHKKIIKSVCPFEPVLEFNYLDYDIQTRHDSDDIVFPNYIKLIQDNYDGNSKVVTFQLKKLLWDQNKTYLHGRKYSSTKCSMFSSLLSPPDGYNIHSYQHRMLGKISPVVVMPQDVCRLVIHKYNKLTKIEKDDILEIDKIN